MTNGKNRYIICKTDKKGLDMIRIDSIGTVKVNNDEVLRYLGYGKNKGGEDVLALIEKCKDEMLSCSTFKACYDIFDLSLSNDTLNFGNIETESKSLKKNLKDCKKAIVFVATIGISIDRVIRKYSMTSPANAVIAQAVGAVMIEEWCDIFCERLKGEGYLRPRFSPGYGDFSLEYQKNIFELLDCPRKIGVSLTESWLMVPSKSVSAIVGISETDTKCRICGCESCDKTECEYRRS